MPRLTPIQRLAFAGPNIVSPRPGVLLRVRADGDYSEELRLALKEGAQFIGMMLAHLEVVSIADGADVLMTVTFDTPDMPFPAIGADLVLAVVQGLQAGGADEASSEQETLLLELHERVHGAGRQQKTMTHLLAEARKRNKPVLRHADGVFQIGYGAKGWLYDPAQAVGNVLPTPPWEQLDSIPIYAVSGGQQRQVWVGRLAQRLEASGLDVVVLAQADYAMVVEYLRSPETRCLVVGLERDSLLKDGLPFDRCRLSVVTDMAEGQAGEQFDTADVVRALGLPALVTEGAVVLNMQVPALAWLADYARAKVYALEQFDTAWLQGQG
jgi:nucleotide-binding universal stress UspA family protein